jgi:aminoglycoside phosphotransferase (APT) family kinase protein
MPEIAIDAALAARLMASQFPHWAELTVRQVEHDGNDNRTFRLGDDLAVRLPSADRYGMQALREQQWLPVLGAGGLTLAITHLVASPSVTPPSISPSRGQPSMSLPARPSSGHCR